MDPKFWDNVYDTKSADNVSWYQEKPARSLELIFSLNLPGEAEIIDVGGGQSKLAECLYPQFKNITVLDISQSALSKLKDHLKGQIPENKISFIHNDITQTTFTKNFDVWHDRAVFHFLTNPDDQKKYIHLLMSSLKEGGYFLIFTFSKEGPKKCSGLDICQYDADDLKAKFPDLKLIQSGQEEHHTPFNTIQKFTYCLFKR